ncbi:MAG TPA: M4 family metallopeptidase [Woeseiaceae bacterium]|nr:M4 family metallopeptidase [Woeseiaceae bacterium]
MKRTVLRFFTGVALSSFFVLFANAAPPTHANNNHAIERLKNEQPGTKVSVNPATDTASFVRMPSGQAKKAARAGGQSIQDEAAAFVSRNAQAFGLRVASSDLKLRTTKRDSLGHTHVSFTQEYAGIPVFGADLKVHFDAAGEISVINGTLIPDIDVSMAPSRSESYAESVAVNYVKPKKNNVAMSANRSRLIIFREGLAKGVPGDNHLAYEVEVGNGVDVREFVYVDAHTGKVIDQITGTPDALNRRAYDGLGLPVVPPSYPGAPFWVEGAPFPTGTLEADNMIIASKETYDLFANAFGRDSFDGAGATMDSIFNRGYSCPNASWNGTFISFCPGLTVDDVTGHEWGHAYTEYTDNLIYQWQPGALNESYSDVVGETVDRLNGTGGDSPDVARTPGSCTVTDGTPPPSLVVTGGSAAGSYFVTASVNEPPAPFTVGPLPMAQSNPAGACTPVGPEVNGKIAIIDWTLLPSGANECGSGTRAANAINAGAAGIIFVAPPAGRLNLGSNALIASVQVTNGDGAVIKAGLPADATITFDVGSDNSVRWLLGEDSSAAGLTGALRDMWTPGCFGDPGKVTDEVYHCATSDQGGVHINSGIPNHAFSLLVDGGNFNGQNISGIGLTKANHIYFRAKTHYQGPATDFAAHADALEQSCSDLVGTNLASLTDGSPSGQVISGADCDQVAKALLAVEMRTPPSQCGFEPFLAQNPPPLCDDPKAKVKSLFKDNFEHGNSSMARWKRSNDGTTPDFTDREWSVVSNLPDNRNGRAFFGPDPTYGSCAPGGDESAVLHLDSPQISVPASADDLRVVFDHWVATEFGYDGGNVKISVNGGPWTLIDYTDFVYNSYNIFLATAGQGNTNPIAGEQAFSGTDGGAVDGTWGRSIINIAPYAGPKDKIRLRFDMGTDGCGGAFGWYVDDVSVYQCR